MLMMRRVYADGLDEFTAPIVLTLLETELYRLKGQQDAARDDGNRPEWGRLGLTIQALHHLYRSLSLQMETFGPMLEEAREELNSTWAAWAARMPRSKANAPILNAERAAREARMAEYRETIAAQRHLPKRKLRKPPEKACSTGL